LKNTRKPSKNPELRLPPALALVSPSAYSSTLKMEVICSSETSVDCKQATWRYVPEDSTLHSPGNLYSNIATCILFFFLIRRLLTFAMPSRDLRLPTRVFFSTSATSLSETADIS
jgi:hypothetical protein